MTTAAQLIALALTDSGVLGVGQTALSEDTNNALTRLNMMLQQWSARRWLVYHLVDTALVCDGSQSYTVGVGGDFNIARPDRLEDAYIRQIVPSTSTPVDWPLTIMAAREDYDRIALKNLAASPSQYIFYDSGYPLGRVYPWPLPNDQYELHIVTKAVLQNFAAVGDTINLPLPYEEALLYCLMQRLRIAYRLPNDPQIDGMAKAALATIRKSNFQVGRLQMPSPVSIGPAYNVYSDRGV